MAGGAWDHGYERLRSCLADFLVGASSPNGARRESESGASRGSSDAFRDEDAEEASSSGPAPDSRQSPLESTSLPAAILDELYASLLRNRETATGGPQRQGGLSYEVLSGWRIEVAHLASFLKRTIDDANEEALQEEGAAAAEDGEEDAGEGGGAGLAGGSQKAAKAPKGRQAGKKAASSQSHAEKAAGGSGDDAQGASLTGLKASACYMMLLALPGCPAFSLFNSTALVSIVSSVRRGIRSPAALSLDLGSQARHKAPQRAGASRPEAPPSPWSVLQGLEAALAVAPLKDSPDGFRTIVELLVEALPFASQIPCAPGGAKGRATAPQKQAIEARLAVVTSVFQKLLAPEHGDQSENAVHIMRSLASQVLLPQLDGTGISRHALTAPAAAMDKARAAALDFVSSHELCATDHGAAAAAATARSLCVNTADRAECRAATVASVVQILQSLSDEQQHRFQVFALRLARNPKPALRVMALEVGVALLEHRLGLAAAAGVPSAAAYEGMDAQAASPVNLSTPDGPKTAGGGEGVHVPEEGQEGGGHPRASPGPAVSPVAPGAAEVLEGRALVHAWLRCWKRRVGDTAAAVKCRALATLGQAVRLAMEAIAELEEFEQPAGHANQAVRGRVELHTSAGKSMDHGSGVRSANSVGEFVVEAVPLVRVALGDEKSAVRRSACGALVALLSATATAPATEDLDALGNMCADPLISLRKAGLTGLSELAQCFPGNADTARAWWEHCLPLVADNEVSAQDQLLQVLSTNILSLVADSAQHRKPGARAGVPANTAAHVFTSGDSPLGAVRACLWSLEGTCQLCPRGTLFCSCKRCGGGWEHGKGREGAPGNKENAPPPAVPGSNPSAANPAGITASDPSGTEQRSSQPVDAAAAALTWLFALGRLRSERTQSLLQTAVARVRERKLLSLPPLVASIQAVIQCAEGHLGQHSANNPAAVPAPGPWGSPLSATQGRAASRGWAQVLKGSWLLLMVLAKHSPQGLSWEFLESRWRRGAAGEGNPQAYLPTAPDPGLAPPAFGEGTGGVPSFHPGSGIPSPPPKTRSPAQAHTSPHAGWSRAGGAHRADVLHVMSAVATAFPRERASEIVTAVKRNLLSMSLGPEEVEAHLSALLTLTYQVHGEEPLPSSPHKAKKGHAISASGAPQLRRAREASRKWSTEIFQKAKGVLQAYLKRPEHGQGQGQGQGSEEGSEGAAQRGATAPVEAALFTVANLALMLHSAWDSEASEGASPEAADSASGGPTGAGAKRKGRQAGASGSEAEALVPPVLLHLIIELGTLHQKGDSTQRSLRFELGEEDCESEGEGDEGDGECDQGVEDPEGVGARTGGAAGASPRRKKARQGPKKGVDGANGGQGGGYATPLASIHPATEGERGAGVGTKGAEEDKAEGGAGGDSIQRQRVAAQAWLALGKLCLMHHEYATRCVPIFVQELERSKNSAIRNNIAMSLADLCVCYTALVDRYIPILAACITDESVTVRHQMIARLVTLLQHDYVKWRGPVVFHLMLALDDEAPQVRNIATHVFRTIVPRKAPLLCYTHFVEAVFWLNGVKLSRATSAQPQPPAEAAGHGGGGVEGGAPSLWEASRKENRQFRRLSPGGAHKPKLTREKRMVVYRTLLGSMAMEHRLALSAKLCAEIVAQVLEDGKLSLDAPADRGAVQDALDLLGTKEMRQGAGSKGGAQGGPEDAAEAEATERGEASGATTAARQRTRVMTQLMKHQLVENTIPIMIELKRLLEFRVDALQVPLMACLRSLFADFKAEIDDLLAADPQLAKELKYDIQKHEGQQARAAAAAALAASGAGGARGTPGAAGKGRASGEGGTPRGGGTPVGGRGSGTPSGGQRNGQGTPTLGEALRSGEEAPRTVPGPLQSPSPSPVPSGSSHKSRARIGAVMGEPSGPQGTPVAASSGREGARSKAVKQEGAEGEGYERHTTSHGNAATEVNSDTGEGTQGARGAPRRSVRLQPGAGEAQAKGALKDQTNRRGKAKGVPQGEGPGAAPGGGTEGAGGGRAGEPGSRDGSSLRSPSRRSTPGAKEHRGAQRDQEGGSTERGLGERPGALQSPPGRHQPGALAGSGLVRGTPRERPTGARAGAGAGAGAATPGGKRGSGDGTPMGAAKLCSLMFSTPLPPSGGGGSRKTVAGSGGARRDDAAAAGGWVGEALFREEEGRGAGGEAEREEEGRGRREDSAAAAMAAAVVAAEVLNDAATGKGTPALGSMAVPRVRSSSSASASKDSGSDPGSGGSASRGRESSAMKGVRVGALQGGAGNANAQSPITTKLFEEEA